MNNSGSEPVEIFSGNMVEAGFVRSLLESQGIHAYLKDELMGTLEPWTVSPGGMGAVKVVVAGRDREESLKILQDMNESPSKR